MSAGQLIEVVLNPAFAAINVSYLALVVATFCKSLNRMRLLLVFAAICFVLYGALQNIGSIVVWNTVIGALNLSRLAASTWLGARTALTAEEETLQRQLFPTLSPAEFSRLWALGRDVCCVDELLVEAGSIPNRLYLIVRGTVHIEHHGVVLDALHTGAVIGHLDPHPFSSPSADWRAAGAVWLRSWALTDLAEPDLPPRVRQSLEREGPALVRARV